MNEKKEVLMTVEGTLYVVASPSGGGKTSLINGLVRALDNIDVAISHTTRPIRPGEKDEQNYFFVSDNDFQSMIKANAFIEYASVFGHYYGTSKEQIEQRLSNGIDVLLDIDWQGARQINALFSNVVSVFIMPPSLDALRERLCDRAQDDEQVIESRMKKAQDEMSHYNEFDFLIVNDVFEEALNQLSCLVRAERLKTPYQQIARKTLLSNLLDRQ